MSLASVKAPNEFQVIVVYKYPSDYPNEYVARNQFVNLRTGDIRRDTTCIHNTDYKVIKNILKGMDFIRVGRFTDDDPCILETWI